MHTYLPPMNSWNQTKKWAVGSILPNIQDDGRHFFALHYFDSEVEAANYTSYLNGGARRFY